MFRPLWIAIPVFLGALMGAHGADAEDSLRLALEKAATEAKQSARLAEADAAPRYHLMPGTVSPDGVWAIGFGAGRPFDNVLLDVRRQRVAGRLAGLNEFGGSGIYGGGEKLFVAWTPDSRRALAICAGRFHSTEIVWMEPAARKFSSALEPLENAFDDWLVAHGEGSFRYLRFSNPAMIGPAVVVVDGATHRPMQDGRTPCYRFKARLTTGAHGVVRCQVLAAHRLEDGGDATSLDDNAVMFGYFQQLHAALSPQARAALEKEQWQWAAWADTQPEDGRGMLNAQRTAWLRARLEFGP